MPLPKICLERNWTRKACRSWTSSLSIWSWSWTNTWDMKDSDHSELEDLLHASKRLPDSRSETTHMWLKEVHRDARNFELEILNSSLLTIIMKRQSIKWKSLIQRNIADIVTMSHSFCIDLLHVICFVKQVQIDIMFMLMNDLIKRYKLIVSHVNFLLEIKLAEISTTFNHYFNDNLKDTIISSNHFLQRLDIHNLVFCSSDVSFTGIRCLMSQSSVECSISKLWMSRESLVSTSQHMMIIIRQLNCALSRRMKCYEFIEI